MPELTYDSGAELGPSPLVSVAVSVPVSVINSVEEEPAEQIEKKYFGYSKDKISTLVCFALVYLSASTIYSLQAPFYPKEAESRGATASEYGFVLGVFQLVMCVMCPVFGIVLRVVSPRLVYNVGIFITAASAIMFGFLDYVTDHAMFIGLSIVLRILQATGDAAFVTATLSIMAMQFQENMATVFASVETFWGLGMLIGPGLGGALYEIGGFVLPFLCMGSCLSVLVVVSYFILPDVSLMEKPDENKFSFYKVLRIPEVYLAFSSVFVTAFSVGFLVATLEPHLRANFGLSPATTGLVFMIDGFMYAMFAPMWGKFCDKTSEPKMFTVIGALLTISGFLLIGPAPFIPINTILWLTCVGLCIHGLGCGSCYVSGFIQSMQGSVNYGLPDNVSTYGLMSGLIMSSLCLGLFLGATIGGVLLDNFGFRMSSLVVFASQALIVLLGIILICIPTKKSSEASESQSSDAETESLLAKEQVNDDLNDVDKAAIDDLLVKQRKSPNSTTADYGSI